MIQTKKMKTFKNLCLLFALMLGIAACSKEAQDAPQALEATRGEEGKSLHVGSRDSIVVNFTIGADSEELRLAQSVNAEGVPFNPFMEEKDVVIRFAVRKQFNGQIYVTYTDAVCKKIAGENKANYKGVIRLPDLNYESYASWPEQYRPTKEGHEIAGILLGEANGGTQFVETVDANTVKTIEQTELLTSENDIVRSKVPYILDWTAFPLTAQGVQTSKQTLHFKPVGNLLRFQLNNQYTEAKTLESFKISTNALVTQAKFDFTQWGRLRNTPSSFMSAPVTASGAAIEVLTHDFRMEKNYALATPIRVEAKAKSKWYYLWVMPVIHQESRVNNGEIVLRTQVVGRASDGKDYNMLAICSPLNEGSNKLTMSFKTPSTLQTAFKGGKLPLWYVAEYDVAPGGRRLTYTNTMPYGDYDNALPRFPQIFGYFTKAELENINVPGYFVPEDYEMAVVHGLDEYHDHGISNRANYFYSIPGINPMRKMTVYENVLFPGETSLQQVSSTYKIVKDPTAAYPIASENYKEVTYGLRFEQCGERDRLTAYRYAFNYHWARGYHYTNGPTTSNDNQQFEVSSVFLGSSFTGDINTISNPDFWANRTDVVRRIFPMIGYDEGFHNRYWTIRLLKNRAWEHKTGQSLIEMGGGNTSGKYPVRLMKNEFKTAQ